MIVDQPFKNFPVINESEVSTQLRSESCQWPCPEPDIQEAYSFSIQFSALLAPMGQGLASENI
jgi:hypothetical protein